MMKFGSSALRFRDVFRHRVFWLVLVVLGGTVAVLQLRPQWMPVWPSVVAMSVAVLTRRVLFALAVGGISGAVIVAQGDFVQGCRDWLVRDVVGSIVDSWKATVILVTLLMGGFASTLENNGVLAKVFTDSKKPLNPRRIESVAFLSGLACFFDGLANSLLVGRVMRAMFDRAEISRIRLAYIADSTASPVACVALASTWIAYQLAMIKEGIDTVGANVSPYALFLASWPAIFYCWASLLCVGLFVFTRWDLGAMAKYQQVSHPAQKDDLVPPNHVDKGTELASTGWWRLWLPPLVLLFSLVGGMWWDGYCKLSAKTNSYAISFVDAVSAADAATVLLVGTVFSCVVAWMCYPAKGTGKTFEEVFLKGAQGMIYPVAVILFAWALGSTLKLLGTAAFLAEMLRVRFPVLLFPAAVFVLSCLIAFSTGTSWGTMGVLLPIVIPLGVEITNGSDPLTTPAIYGAVAAVMSGAVFGDHCSPVSDTTIVAATSSGCSTWEHVTTQFPYAITAATISVVVGYIPLGLGLPAWLCLVAVCLTILLFRAANTLPIRKP